MKFFGKIIAFVFLAIALLLGRVANAGKLDAAQQAASDCRVESNTVSGPDGTKSQGYGNFCSPKATGKVSTVGDKKMGFGDGVTGVTPGFIPAPGDAGYAVLAGDKYFWVWAVNNSGAAPADAEFLDRFPQTSNVLSAHYVKGALPTGQLPWAQVLGSKDASVTWAMPANNAEVVIQIKQVPPGPGYVVLYLEQKAAAGAVAPTAAK